MSLLGIISDASLRVRMAAGRQDGWGISVDGPEERWTANADSGGGSVAVYQRSGNWFVSDDERWSPQGASEAIGEIVLAAVALPAERATLARSVPWVFVYEGTIAKGDALCAALDPGWVVTPALRRRPGTLILAHLVTYLSRVDRRFTADAAISKATTDLRRTRGLGSSAFPCSNGTTLYAYTMGGRFACRVWPAPLSLAHRRSRSTLNTSETSPTIH